MLRPSILKQMDTIPGDSQGNLKNTKGIKHFDINKNKLAIYLLFSIVSVLSYIYPEKHQRDLS